jgi:hypothetical protein
MPDEHGFGHYRAGAAGTGESRNGHQQMQQQDGQVAHRRILPRSRPRQRMLMNLEFAMDNLSKLKDHATKRSGRTMPGLGV